MRSSWTRAYFPKRTARGIARSLKRSAERSHARKSSQRSAMSMLTFYINRAGSNLPASRRKIRAQILLDHVSRQWDNAPARLKAVVDE